MTLRSVANISQAPNAGTPPLSSSFALTQTEQWGVSSSNPTMSMIYILYFITYTVHSDLESRLAIQIQVDVLIYVHIHNQTLASSCANIHELSRSKSSLAGIGGNPLQWHAMDLNLTAWWNYIQHLCCQLNTFRIVSQSKFYIFSPSAKGVDYITWLRLSTGLQSEGTSKSHFSASWRCYRNLTALWYDTDPFKKDQKSIYKKQLKTA